MNGNRKKGKKQAVIRPEIQYLEGSGDNGKV